MNINMTLECDTCGEPTNCRIGMSNRQEQRLRFCCPDCSAPIDLVFGLKKGGGITGAHKIEGKQPFEAGTNFVDLHLDFPVSFEPYIMGNTPFMAATRRIGFAEMQLHSARLNTLNAEFELFPKFKTLLKLYAAGKTTPFKMNAQKTFGVPMKSELPQDVNATLYRLIADMMRPFAMPGANEDVVELYMNMVNGTMNQDAVAVEAFLRNIIDSGFLKKLQLDCLEIYPRILAAELPMRPALFLDYDDGYHAEPIPMRVSTDEFETYKDLYKDICEIVARQLVLVAGLNNLQKRNDHNSFKPGIGLGKSGKDRTPTSLDAFADVNFGDKLNFIDASWYKFDNEAADNQMRNAIAHFKTDYDEITQKITYFPRKEGMKEEKSEETSFLDFMRRILIAYREMHALHHLVKSLFYYEYLVKKPQP